MVTTRLVTVFAVALTLAAQQTYKVGDRVEAYHGGWNKGAVTQIGSGTYDGYFMVKYDAFSTERWFHPRDLRPGGPAEAPKQYPVYKPGDRVEGYDFGWQPGRILEVRAGKDSQEYLIQYEKFSTQRWYHPRDMRSAAAAAAEQAEKDRASASAVQGPRLGKYGIQSYGAVSAPPLYLGHFELMAGGKYRISRTSGEPYYGEGTYRFNAATLTVEWQSGPLAAPEWGGKFSVVDGNRHRIALRARTIATNSQ